MSTELRTWTFKYTTVPGYNTFVLPRRDGSYNDKWYQNRVTKRWHRSLVEVKREVNGEPSEDTHYHGAPPPLGAVKACTCWAK
jgi:hypothetical protein